MSHLEKTRQVLRPEAASTTVMADVAKAQPSPSHSSQTLLDRLLQPSSKPHTSAGLNREGNASSQTDARAKGVESGVDSAHKQVQRPVSPLTPAARVQASRDEGTAISSEDERQKRGVQAVGASVRHDNSDEEDKKTQRSLTTTEAWEAETSAKAVVANDDSSDSSDVSDVSEVRTSELSDFEDSQPR